MIRFYESHKQGILESAESIELLRAIENSMNFKVIQSSAKMVSVDTPQDLEHAEIMMKKDSLKEKYL